MHTDKVRTLKFGKEVFKTNKWLVKEAEAL